MIRSSLLLAVALLAGCWNGGNTNLDLGSVSLGQQLMDLKAARDAGAIDHAEYEATRGALLEAVQRLGDDAASDDAD
jgi:hypothetical protein